MAFSNAQTKVESGNPTGRKLKPAEKKARTELEQFWRKTAKEYGSVITEEELFAHDPELFKRWIAKAAKYEELLESCREIENNLAIKKGALPGLIESVELLEKSTREKSEQAAELQAELKSKRLQRDKLFGTKLVEVERKPTRFCFRSWQKQKTMLTKSFLRLEAFRPLRGKGLKRPNSVLQKLKETFFQQKPIGRMPLKGKI